MARAPILPTNWHDPTGTEKMVAGAIRKFSKLIYKAPAIYAGVLEKLKAAPVVNAKYAYELDLGYFEFLLSAASADLEALIFDGATTPANLWFTAEYVAPAYLRGTAQEYSNLARQSEVYRAARPNLQSVLGDDAYRLRIALLQSRQFEQMKGLVGEIKADMTRVLTQGIAAGDNPREVAQRLRDLVGIEENRANRIARTEIGTALRTAKLDESEDAQERYKLRMLEMHLSALSPTTRATHAQRHGKLYTAAQQREWQQSDGNSINCKCSSTSVLVDENGKPLVPGVQQRAQDIFKRWSAQNE